MRRHTEVDVRWFPDNTRGYLMQLQYTAISGCSALTNCDNATSSRRFLRIRIIGSPAASLELSKMLID